MLGAKGKINCYSTAEPQRVDFTKIKKSTILWLLILLGLWGCFHVSLAKLVPLGNNTLRSAFKSPTGYIGGTIIVLWYCQIFHLQLLHFASLASCHKPLWGSLGWEKEDQWVEWQEPEVSNRNEPAAKDTWSGIRMWNYIEKHPASKQCPKPLNRMLLDTVELVKEGGPGKGGKCNLFCGNTQI